MKYIVVTGGVISGIGKGITSSSIAFLFKSCGFTVTMIKIDPYLNVDAGLMSPFEHGECYVLSDGGECDLDLGNYERFLGIELSRNHNITTGSIYQSVINKERKGEYLGSTVQVVPHVTDEIISRISQVSKLPVKIKSDNNNFSKIPDICVIEIGGTIGDIEGLPFIEAIQQMQSSENKDSFCFVHVAMAINNPELKTKPIQHSISALRSRGIFPNVLVIRSNDFIPDDIKLKITKLCNIPTNSIISNPNVPTIYHVPKLFYDQKVCQQIAKFLNLSLSHILIAPPYTKILSHLDNISSLKTIKIGIAGKYTGSPDTYLSLVNAIQHAAFFLNINHSIIWINTDDESCDLSHIDAFIIPGGFGYRGIHGKLRVSRYARINNIPLLGICLGMQIMVVDSLQFYGISNATSREWSDDSNSLFVIDLLPGQTDTKGATMRLGNYDSLLFGRLKDIYNADFTVERHRHRYEVNNSFLNDIISSGLSISGINPLTNLVEIVELPNHPFYIGCQFHPEYNSFCDQPHPLFVELLRSCFP